MLAKLETFDKGRIIYKGKPWTSKNEEFIKILCYLFQNFSTIRKSDHSRNLELGLITKTELKKQEKRDFFKHYKLSDQII